MNNVDVVVQADELLRGPVEERLVDRPDGRIDQPEEQHQDRRADEAQRDDPPGNPLRPVDREQDRSHHDRKQHDGEHHDGELLGRGVRPEQYVAHWPHPFVGAEPGRGPRSSRSPAGGPGSGLRPECPYGHEASIESRTSWSALSLAIQLVISVQNEPAPTSPGIRSEPSKRKTASGSCSSSPASWSIGDYSSEMSSSLLALTHPGVETSAFAFAHSGELRNCWKASTSGRSANAATNSPPPSSGRPCASSIGGR